MFSSAVNAVDATGEKLELDWREILEFKLKFPFTSYKSLKLTALLRGSPDQYTDTSTGIVYQYGGCPHVGWRKLKDKAPRK